MDAERWKRIEQVFQDVLDRSRDQRDEVLGRACSGDESLRRDVESLLEHYADGGRFMERPAVLPPLSHRPGTTIGHYRILEEIGVGGMGVVYKAEDTRLGRVIALKFLAGRFGGAEALHQFRGEARAASALNHPNVCVIYGIEEIAGEQFIAMEFVEGRTLAELIAGKPLEPDAIATFGSQIADALAIAHRQGIVHRDVKPANLIVTASGLVKVLDFGLAKLHGDGSRVASAASRDTGPIAGTLPYMSPEQLRGSHVDHRADIFALGAVLYEMATGQRPFARGTVPDVIDQILNRQPIAAQHLNRRISAGLARLIDRCLDKEPARRYPTADAIAADLRRLVPDARRERGTSLLLVTAATLAAIGTAVMVWPLRERGGEAQRQPAWEQLTDFPDSATSPALSSDGRTLAFIRGASTFVGAGDVYYKTLPGGDPVQLTDDSHQKQDPLFSPDGSKIVYTTGPLPYDVWSVPVSGGSPAVMMRNASRLTWTGAGRLLFSEVRGAPHMAVVTADADRGNVRDVYVPSRVSGMAHRAYLSPDEKWVLIAEMDTAGTGWLPCRLVPLDGRSPGDPVGPPGAACTSAAWSSDGSWMYLSASAGGSFHIWRQSFPRGEPQQVTFGPTQEEGIAIAPDGRSLITSVGTAQSTLSLRDANGERRVNSEATVTWPRFSRDGRTLFYIAQKQLGLLDRQSGELWAVDVASGKRERVLPGFRVVTYDISPDEARVAVIAVDEQGRSHLWLAPLDRSAPPARVEWPTEVASALFDGAGGLFLRAREHGGEFVHYIDPRGANRRRVIATQVAGLVAVSPSGKWVLARARLPGPEASSPGVVAYPTDGGNPVVVFESMWPTAYWTPDGKEFHVRFGGENGRPFAIAAVPVSPSGDLPVLPAGGLPSANDAARLRGARILTPPVPADSDLAEVALTMDLSTVALVRTAVHRNLYRIPLP